jgi:hypothetical protein
LWPTFASAAGVNIVSNGNFASTTGWSGIGCVLTASSNTLIGTGNGSQTYLNASYISSKNRTKQTVYASMRIRVTDATDCADLRIYVAGANYIIKSTPTSNTWYPFTILHSDLIGDGTPLIINARANYDTTGHVNGKVMEVQEVVCIDVTEYGQPAPYFDGTNDVLTIANSASVDILGAPLVLNAVFNSYTPPAIGYILAKNLDGAVNIQYALQANTTNLRTEFYLEGSSRQSSADSSIPLYTQKTYSGTFDTAVQQGYANDVASGSAGNYNGALTSRANMQIGARSNNAGGTAWSTFFKGYISELIILRSTSGRSRIEANQLKYFGTK